MIQRKSTFFLGIFIFLIPFSGFTSSWKIFFIAASGIILVLLSIKLSLPKKPVRQRIKKEKVTPVYVQNSPIESTPVKTEKPIVGDSISSELK